ncbi:unnamed protein product, partial [Cladocopium goreaui]
MTSQTSSTYPALNQPGPDSYNLVLAKDIRLHAIRTFGYIIHEFDPWFNYRAAEYLAQHGLRKFFQWYDYMSWYPIGRPIGTTIYPGMQMWAVGIFEALKHVPSTKVWLPFIPPLRPLAKWAQRNGWLFIPSPLKSRIQIGPMSVNDICCMIPPWFGSTASIFTGLLAYEISRSVNAGLMATGIMAVIPAHIMRSVGGKFDNEAVAMTAIVMTFWLWLLSVRSPKHWPIGILTGLSYINMVAAWGGYIFVLNMIGVHALILVAQGRFNSGVHKAYSLFFIVGTYGAIQIPVVGMQPLRSLEQMGPLLVFVGYQVLAFCDSQRRKKNLSTWDFVKLRILMSIATLVALAVVAVLLYPTGYFGPLSSRIRGPEDGGGRMQVVNRTVLRKFPRPHTVGDISPHAFSDARGPRVQSMAQHKYNDVMLKHKKFETTRERDQKYIRLMVEVKEDQRQARMTRLVENLTAGNARNPDYQASLQLTEFLANREATVSKHYLDWDKNVFGPVAKKAFFHMNRHKIKPMTSFNLDAPSIKLYVDTTKDPGKTMAGPSQASTGAECFGEILPDRILVSMLTEADLAITGSQPQPSFPLDMLHSQSRPVLEPDLWGQYGSSVFGRFTELLDPRSTKAALRRSGRNVHLPPDAETDGCGEVAGTRHSRLFGYNDKGILQSARDRGEAQIYKNDVGASSGAPAQDHFTYERGPEIVSTLISGTLKRLDMHVGARSQCPEHPGPQRGRKVTLRRKDFQAFRHIIQAPVADFLEAFLRSHDSSLQMLEAALKEAKNSEDLYTSASCEVVTDELFALLDFQSFQQVMKEVIQREEFGGGPGAFQRAIRPVSFEVAEVAGCRGAEAPSNRWGMAGMAGMAGMRCLFVKHTKTGNPLVDSVAEHQPANPKIYASHLGMPLDYVLLGGLVCIFNRNNGFYFMCLYGFIASHFSGKMSRLVLICGPIVSVACGIWCGFLLDMVIEPFLLLLGKKGYVAKPSTATVAPPTSGDEKSAKAKGKNSKGDKGKDAKQSRREAETIELEEWEE